jgi:hypothetical protein
MVNSNEERRAMAPRAKRQRLFGPGKTIHGNVALNFMGRPESEFGIYAAGFWRAGRTLANSLAKELGYRDFDACPIVFLYSHALELYMKAIVHRGRNLVSLAGKKLPIDRRLLNRHELLPLTQPILYIFKHVGWTWSTEVEGVKTFRDFKAIVREIDRLGTAFRYPIDTKGQPSVSHHFVFNVLEFARQLEGAIRLLDGAITGLEEEWDQRAAAAYERQQA